MTEAPVDDETCRYGHLAGAEFARAPWVVEWARAATIVSALTALTALQAVWISRALDRVYAALDRRDSRLDNIERAVLRDHADGIARLEAARD